MFFSLLKPGSDLFSYFLFHFVLIYVLYYSHAHFGISLVVTQSFICHKTLSCLLDYSFRLVALIYVNISVTIYLFYPIILYAAKEVVENKVYGNQDGNEII